jgi:tRNA U54 and U55 pseudouridine synthase Pus10
MNLQSRKMQMQDDIEKLLSDKFSKTINDSTALRLFKAVTQLLSLLSTKENDMRQKLININKKFERIESNIFKTKTNIEIYAVAIKIESLTNVDVTTTTRRDLNVSTFQQKTFTEIKKKDDDDKNQQRSEKNNHSNHDHQRFDAKIKND